MRTTIAVIGIGLLIGAAVGVGAYTFVYAKGYSYLTNNPAACANCHAMEQYYSGWMKGPHRAAAVCNDCHTPHDLAGKYATKASNGFWHSFYFTSGRYPDVIEAKQRSIEVTERACRRCHADVVQAIDAFPAHRTGGEMSCIRCHADAGHL
ncbi:MAG TPA: cytochrome c nitrite reductase small subunit [Thermoanaerobaculia bacterium]